MLSLQEGGSKLMSDNPYGLFFLTGPDYGVKNEYINKLKTFYENECLEYSNLETLLDTFTKKSLIPRKPKLYIVRYDTDFIRIIDKTISDKINKLNIEGTIISIYDDDKSEAKLDKYFPNKTLRINSMTNQICYKHLSKLDIEVDSKIMYNCIEKSFDYYQAQLNCKCLNYLPINILRSITNSEVNTLFGYTSAFNSNHFKELIAGRNYTGLIHEIDKCTDDLSRLLYDVISTMVEIIKRMNTNYGESYVDPYLKYWNVGQAKYILNEAFEQLTLLRNFSSYKSYNSLLYVCALLKFRIG